MSVIKLRILVANLEEVLALYNRIKVYRSTTGPTGTYVEITTAMTRIPLVSEEEVYEYQDLTGAASYYYKTTYYHSSTLIESDASAPAKGEGTGNYVSTQDMRDEGVTEAQASDSKLLALIQQWEQFVEANTGQWFYPRDMTLELDGSGSYLLQLQVPIIRVDSLYINTTEQSVTPLDSGTYIVYNRRYPDDRTNPRIKIKSTVGSAVESFFQVGGGNFTSLIFKRGERNQQVVGTFGYTEDDGTAPLLIRYAVKKLVSLNLQPLGVGGASMLAGPVTKETADKHSISYSEKMLPSGFSLSGDPEIDRILRQYRRPLVINAPYGEIV